MTVTVLLSSEKPAPEAAILAPNNPDPHTGTGSYLKSKDGKLKLAQITCGLLVWIFVSQCYRLSIVEFIFTFLSINTSLLTAFILWDNSKGGKVRNLVRLDIPCEKLELRYNAFAALLYYIVFITPTTNLLVGMAGMLASIAYGYDWWSQYRKSLLERLKVAKLEDFDEKLGTVLTA